MFYELNIEITMQWQRRSLLHSHMNNRYRLMKIYAILLSSFDTKSSLMVRFILHNPKRTINLLDQHQFHQLMGKRHL